MTKTLSGHPALQRWTTDSVPAHQRYEYYQDALGSALAPMSVTSDGDEYLNTELRTLALDQISFVRCVGTPHKATRSVEHIERSAAHSFHLMVNLAQPFNFVQRSRARIGPRESTFVDSNLTFELDLPYAYDIINLRLGEAFVKRWVPHSGVLSGRRIPFDHGWGGALSAFARQLSPEFVLRSPLPMSVISDHLGSLLALAANEIAGVLEQSVRRDRSMSERIHDRIVERCTEFSLTAADIAQSLHISVRTLHRCLAACGQTFGQMLMAARVEVAMRMLTSSLFGRVTAAEIGRRAGFSDASHFTRVFRRHTGRLPTTVRSAAKLN
jgi:AraC-like DNA-binding protein